MEKAKFDAYYAGRNDVWADDDLRAREDFATQAEWAEYRRGVKSARSELRLDADTEWG